MPVDPQIKPLVDFVNAVAAEAPPIWDQTEQQRREGYHTLLEAVSPGPELAEVAQRTIQRDGGEIPARIYRPEDGAGVLIYYHGGGWVIGDLDTHDEVCRQLASQAGATVVSIDYRLGPEAKFPAAVQDCWDALRWVDQNRSELGGPKAKIAVCGDSAGANLAAVMCLLARDQGGPAIAAQLLVYPSVDLRLEGFESLEANRDGYLLTLETMRWFREKYLGSDADQHDWRASPLLADSHEGLPPALVITAEFDPLRDEGAAYAAALSAAGVEVVHSNYEGMIHIFFQLGPSIDATADAIAQVAAAAKRAL